MSAANPPINHKWTRTCVRSRNIHLVWKYWMHKSILKTTFHDYIFSRHMCSQHNTISCIALFNYILSMTIEIMKHSYHRLILNIYITSYSVDILKDMRYSLWFTMMFRYVASINIVILIFVFLNMMSAVVFIINCFHKLWALWSWFSDFTSKRKTTF